MRERTLFALIMIAIVAVCVVGAFAIHTNYKLETEKAERHLREVEAASVGNLVEQDSIDGIIWVDKDDYQNEKVGQSWYEWFFGTSN